MLTVALPKEIFVILYREEEEKKNVTRKRKIMN